jgi:RecQ family ATP-dependent DNA helicase
MCHAHAPRKQQQQREQQQQRNNSSNERKNLPIDLAMGGKIVDLVVPQVASTESARKKRKRERQKNGMLFRHDVVTISDEADADVNVDVMSQDDHILVANKVDPDGDDMPRKQNAKSISTNKRETNCVDKTGSKYYNPLSVESDRFDYQTTQKTIERHKKVSSSNTLVQSSLFGNVVHKNKENGSKNETQKKKRKHPSSNATNTAFKVPLPVPSITTTSYSNSSSIHYSLPQNPVERYQHLYQKAMQTLATTFRIKSLRNLQPQAIQSALQNKSQIIIMATGGGKSLCYQLPASVLPGVTIVVSPLIALMVDQVRSLTEKGIEAACICSANTQKENKMIMERLKGGPQGSSGKANSRPNNNNKNGGGGIITTKPIKLLYCTPELIQTPRFRTVLTELHSQNLLSLIAIDEAHCLSTWGHDFRPSYRKLSWIRQSFPTIPCMACTATATAKVISDMRHVLGFGPDVECHISTFNRPNIHYEVRYKDTMGDDAAMKDLIHVIKKEHELCRKDNRPCSGIIYVHKRNDTELLTLKIKEAGVTAAPYHGGLKDGERKEIQDKWTSGEVQVAVATVAFGMGIDLAHVRYVLHWSLPKSVEGFYQESGRGGRDGLTAKSILYYSKDDSSKFTYLIKKQEEAKAAKENRESRGDNAKLTALYEMVDYCTTVVCRRQFLLKHFGELIDPAKICKKTCDYCMNPKKAESAINGSVTSSSRSRAIRDVKNQMKRFKTGSAHFRQEYSDNGGGSDQAFFKTVNKAGLGITQLGSASDSISDYKGSKSTKDILSHYEAKECGERDGFVTFKAKGKGKKALEHVMSDKSSNESVSKSIPMPAHLLAKISNLHSKASSSSKCNERIQSSTEISSEADKLRAELASLKNQKKQLVKAKSSTSVASKPPPPPPPPPILSMRSNRRSKNHRPKKSKRK